jgi:hypothetical protein
LSDCELDEVLTYSDIYDKYGSGEAIEQFLIELSNTSAATYTGYGTYSISGNSFYFCIPENDQFGDYWEKVEDRLYKIRNCMNISGVVRQLALFQPPINPMALVRAAASGRDIGSVISEASSPIPYYRFGYLIEKAKGFASVVQQFGGSLLSALEKKDAEELALLRSTHEKTILDLTTSMKEKQIEEATETIKSLEESKARAETLKSHYERLLEAGLLPREESNKDLMIKGGRREEEASILNAISSGLFMIPQIGGQEGFGGKQLGHAFAGLASIANALAIKNKTEASITLTIAGYTRRKQEWLLQKTIASHEIDQIEAQKMAAEIRKEMLEKELEIHEKSIEQKEEEYNFLKDKFTDNELYQWMVSQLSSIYFQAYKMAYELAKAAEKSFQFERHTDDVYIDFGHWDSLKKGLLSGERLNMELLRLDKAYIEDNKREMEIEKTISLAQLNPFALYNLKENGSCEFSFSEQMFDRDFPGHYCRRIKSISISIPAVVGPYQDIKASLMQMSNKILVKSDIDAVTITNNIIELDSENDKVRSNWRMNEKVAISKGVNDSGMFELNFRDERYLPFEGTGAVSTWKLEMLKPSNDFDFDTISDVIFHLKYTALYDGSLRTHIFDNYSLIDGYRIISLRHEFSTEWHRFMNPENSSANHELEFTLSEKMFPYNLTNIEISEVNAKLILEGLEKVDELTVQLNLGDADAADLVFSSEDTTASAVSNGVKAFGDSTIKIDRKSIPSNLLRKDENGYDKTEGSGEETYYYIDYNKLTNIVLIIYFKGTLSWPSP